MKDAMSKFMAGHDFCVISTVTKDSQPEAALVGFSHNDTFEIIVGTSSKTRKYQNLLTNPSIALVIGDTTGEVQYEGVAEIIADITYRKLIEEAHFKKLPGAMKYRDDPTQVYLKITPKWIRFIQHGEFDQVEEFTEFA